jgi:hypothetical protein
MEKATEEPGMKIMLGWAAVVLLVVSSAGCMTMAGFEEAQQAKAGKDPDVKLMPTLKSSERYAAYRAEVDSWSGTTRVFLLCNDLLLDFTDMFSCEYSFGPGILADGMFTKLGEVGLGYADVEKVGWRKRAAGFYKEKRREGGFSYLYYRDMDVRPDYGTYDLFLRPRAMRDFSIRHNVTDRHWADIGFQVHFVAIGTSHYFSPKEAADFVCSLVLFPCNLVIQPLSHALNFTAPEIDIGDDDSQARVRHKYGIDMYSEPEQFLPVEITVEAFDYGF